MDAPVNDSKGEKNSFSPSTSASSSTSSSEHIETGPLHKINTRRSHCQYFLSLSFHMKLTVVSLSQQTGLKPLSMFVSLRPR